MVVRQANRLDFIRGLLYDLKHEYGQHVDIYKKISSTNDLQTGVKNVVKNKISIRNGVVLASEEVRKFQYAQAFLKANRQFAYGGFFDISDRIVLVDRRDLPSGWIISIDDYVIVHPEDTFSCERYEVKRISEYENKQGYILYVKELTNTALSQIVDINVNNTSILSGNDLNIQLLDQAQIYKIATIEINDTLVLIDQNINE